MNSFPADEESGGSSVGVNLWRCGITREDLFRLVLPAGFVMFSRLVRRWVNLSSLEPTPSLISGEQARDSFAGAAASQLSASLKILSFHPFTIMVKSELLLELLIGLSHHRDLFEP